ncbi:hypothetical protein AB6A40_003383 [Gnathostoma spinigerum]|uniref:Uncharacterized protein n=1 Tax=Gnathostoma spinigerum TaxID=75299 RepID=A0ABD6EEY2_9BILA
MKHAEGSSEGFSEFTSEFRRLFGLDSTEEPNSTTTCDDCAEEQSSFLIPAPGVHYNQNTSNFPNDYRFWLLLFCQLILFFEMFVVIMCWWISKNKKPPRKEIGIAYLKPTVSEASIPILVKKQDEEHIYDETPIENETIEERI